jgi:hypothetical protein
LKELIAFTGALLNSITAFGFLSVVPAISATESRAVRRGDDLNGEPFGPDEGTQLSLPLQISKGKNLNFSAVVQVPGASGGGVSVSELNIAPAARMHRHETRAITIAEISASCRASGCLMFFVAFAVSIPTATNQQPFINRKLQQAQIRSRLGLNC